MAISRKEALSDTQLEHVTGGTSVFGYVEYIAKAGDTLASVASRYHVTEADLRGLNSLTNDTLYYGQIVKVPVRMQAMRSYT